VIFEKLVQVLVFGCAYHRIADEECSATTLRDRRDEWIEIGAMDALREIVLEAYDRFIGLELSDVAVDGCITKAPCGAEKAGRSPVDRGKRGTKRSTAVDARGIPLGTVTAPANRHDTPPLAETLDAVAETLGGLPEGTNIHLDRGYDSETTRQRLRERALSAEISRKGEPAPLAATSGGSWRGQAPGQRPQKACVVHGEAGAGHRFLGGLLGGGHHRVGRLILEGWTRYRWEGRSLPKAMTYPRKL
jgi:hypothetical protein